jgi:hypothetical protein
MLDGTVVKIMNLKKSAQMIVCYFVADSLALVDGSAFIIQGHGVVPCPKIL